MQHKRPKSKGTTEFDRDRTCSNRLKNLVATESINGTISKLIKKEVHSAFSLETNSFLPEVKNIHEYKTLYKKFDKLHPSACELID